MWVNQSKVTVRRQGCVAVAGIQRGIFSDAAIAGVMVICGGKADGGKSQFHGDLSCLDQLHPAP